MFKNVIKYFDLNSDCRPSDHVKLTKGQVAGISILLLLTFFVGIFAGTLIN